MQTKDLNWLISRASMTVCSVGLRLQISTRKSKSQMPSKLSNLERVLLKKPKRKSRLNSSNKTRQVIIKRVFKASVLR